MVFLKKASHFSSIGYRKTKHRIKILWLLLLHKGWLTWQKGVNMDKGFITLAARLADSLLKSGISQNPLANKPCSSWMKWDGILKAFHMSLPSRPFQSLSLCLWMIKTSIWLQSNTRMFQQDCTKICWFQSWKILVPTNAIID